LVSDDVSARRNDDVYRTLSSYSYGTGADYALGAAVQVDAQNWKDGNSWGSSSTINSYVWRDGAVQVGTTYGAWYNSYNYEIVGGQAQLQSVVIADGRPRTVSFVNDFLGQGIKRDERDNLAGGDPHEVWYRFSGRQMGYVGNNGTMDVDYLTSAPQQQQQGPAPASYADFDLAYNPINAYEQGSRGGVYIVQAGDTLQGIAANLWGDATLWYKLAEANGLQGDAALVEGAPLIIPVGVQTNANNATTFKPIRTKCRTSRRPLKAPHGRHGRTTAADFPCRGGASPAKREPCNAI
jgi:trimeric autotransporter adhesin